MEYELCLNLKSHFDFKNDHPPPQTSFPPHPTPTRSSTFSLPARSTRYSFPLSFCSVSMFSCLMLMRKMLWLRELCSFMSVGRREKHSWYQLQRTEALSLASPVCHPHPPRKRVLPGLALPLYLPGSRVTQRGSLLLWKTQFSFAIF